MKVVLPSPVYSYTGGRGEVEAAGATLAEVLAALDRQYPGIRFRLIDEQDRIRQHIKIFVNSELVPDLTCPLQESDTVMIVAALSGG